MTASGTVELADSQNEPCDVVGTVDASALARRWMDEFKIDVSGVFGAVKTINVLRGRDSGILYFDPPLAGDETLYHRLAGEDWYYLNDKWEHQRSLANLRAGQDLLEIGCGRGAYLKKVEAKGAKALGVELNSNAAEYARRHGLNVVETDIYDAPAEWAGAFDVVSTFQVLEHVPNPVEFCRRLFAFVRPGGELHVAVPNHSGFMGQADVLLDYPPHHLSRWPVGSMAYLGKALGAANSHVVAGPLEPMHFGEYLNMQRNRFGRIAVNRLTLPLWRAGLTMGARRWVPGHTILGIYHKAPA